MQLLYKKLGTVKKPDGTDFNIYGFNQMPYAEYILKGTTSDYARNGWMKIKGTDDVTYFVPFGARPFSITDKEYKDRRPGESRLRTPWEDDYLDCLDYSADWQNALENNSLTFRLQMITSQTKEYLGYGNYRYTNTYKFNMIVTTSGDLSWSDWLNTFWPSGSVKLKLEFKNKTVTETFDKDNQQASFSDSSWTDTNTTGSTFSTNSAGLYIQPDISITSPKTGIILKNYLDCGQYSAVDSCTITLKYWSGNE